MGVRACAHVCVDVRARARACACADDACSSLIIKFALALEMPRGRTYVCIAAECPPANRVRRLPVRARLQRRLRPQPVLCICKSRTQYSLSTEHGMPTVPFRPPAPEAGGNGRRGSGTHGSGRAAASCGRPSSATRGGRAWRTSPVRQARAVCRTARWVFLACCGCDTQPFSAVPCGHSDPSPGADVAG